MGTTEYAVRSDEPREEQGHHLPRGQEVVGLALVHGAPERLRLALRRAGWMRSEAVAIAAAVRLRRAAAPFTRVEHHGGAVARADPYAPDANRDFRPATAPSRGTRPRTASRPYRTHRSRRCRQRRCAQGARPARPRGTRATGFPTPRRRPPQVEHAVRHEHTRARPEDPLADFRAQRPVNEAGVLVVLPDDPDGAAEVPGGQQLVHDPAARELPLARQVCARQRPRLELPNQAALDEDHERHLQQRAEDVVPMRAEKITAKRKGSMNQVMQSFHVMLSSFEQRVAVVNRHLPPWGIEPPPSSGTSRPSRSKIKRSRRSPRPRSPPPSRRRRRRSCRRDACRRCRRRRAPSPLTFSLFAFLFPSVEGARVGAAPHLELRSRSAPWKLGVPAERPAARAAPRRARARRRRGAVEQVWYGIITESASAARLGAGVVPQPPLDVRRRVGGDPDASALDAAASPAPRSCSPGMDVQPLRPDQDHEHHHGIHTMASRRSPAATPAPGSR